MRILITGGCGLVGTNLAKYYKNEQVLVVDNFERNSLLGHHSADLSKIFYNRTFLKNLGINVVNLDISKKISWDTIEKEHGTFDVIFHMAAFVGVSSSYKNPQRSIEINTYGTALMLEAARKWGAKVVYPSTFKVYGIEDNWLLENHRWRWADATWNEKGYPIGYFQDGPRSPYGAAKYAGEILCREYAHSYDLPIGIFRMSNIYGQHQISFEEQGWLTWFIIANIRGYSLNIFGDGCQVRDLLYVNDLVKAYDSFIKSKINFGIWNIGGGPEFTMSLNEAIEEIEVHSDKLFSALEYRDWRKSDLKVYTSDISKVKLDLDWTPTINPTEGIKKVYKWISNTTALW